MNSSFTVASLSQGCRNAPGFARIALVFAVLSCLALGTGCQTASRHCDGSSAILATETLSQGLAGAPFVTKEAFAVAATDFGATVRKFGTARHKLAQDLSARLSLPLPSEAGTFFHAAITGNWEAVSNHFPLVKEPGGYERAIPQLQNELWAPIHETLGLWEVWIGWKEDSALLTMFGDSILSSMPKGSIYFGGTDCGRFVITAMNATREPPTVFCITQNALADNTYAAHLRATSGDNIWLPQVEDSAKAFQQFVDDWKTGKTPLGADIKTENGRMQVTGVQAVMAFNGILCKMIFDHNKDAHGFFVEESYVLDWMYPYLEPCGLIMKLNPQSTNNLSADIVARDRTFWNQYVGLLEGHPGFTNNIQARKAFSKLRAGIAGLYAYRKMYGEAKAAFQQAIRLCPASPEASFRLAHMYEEQGRTAEALKVMADYLTHVPPDARDKAAAEYVERLKNASSTVEPK